MWIVLVISYFFLPSTHPHVAFLIPPSLHREEEYEEGEETPLTESSSDDDGDDEEGETKPFSHSVIR